MLCSEYYLILEDWELDQTVVKLSQFSAWMLEGSLCAAGMLWWKQHLIYTIWRLQLPWPNTGDSACDHMSGSGQSAVLASCTPTYVCRLSVELLGRDPGLYPGALLWQRAVRECVFFYKIDVYEHFYVGCTVWFRLN